MNVSIYVYIYIYVYMYVCICVYIYVFIYVYMYTCVHAYMYICMYVDVSMHTLTGGFDVVFAYKKLQDTSRHCKTLQPTATYTATHCNTLQHRQPPQRTAVLTPHVN